MHNFLKFDYNDNTSLSISFEAYEDLTKFFIDRYLIYISRS